MKIRLHDSLANEVRDFEPEEPGVVKLYTCGPTVYLPQHIGNFRAFMFEDVLRRTLELAGFEVRQVMNITDVGHLTVDTLADAEGEDKLEVSALREGKQPLEIAAGITERFHRDRKTLRIKDAAAYPKATDHIPEMIDLIRRLVDRGHAYAVNGNVYYEVATFPGYGKLSKNTIEGLVAGARIAVNPEKRHPAPGGAASRAGTSSARPWRSSTSARRPSTSTAGARTTSSPTTSARSPRARGPSACPSRGSGCTTAS